MMTKPPHKTIHYIKQHKNIYTYWHWVTMNGLHQWSSSIFYIYWVTTDSLYPGDVIVVADDVIVVVVDAVQLVLFPECTWHHFLLKKDFLQEFVTDAQGEVAVDEVHEADTRSGIVTYPRLRREQWLHDGVYDWAQVLGGWFGKILEEVLGLRDVVFSILF